MERIAVVLEGGVVQAVVSDPSLCGIEVAIVNDGRPTRFMRTTLDAQQVISQYIDQCRENTAAHGIAIAADLAAEALRDIAATINPDPDVLLKQIADVMLALNYGVKAAVAERAHREDRKRLR